MCFEPIAIVGRSCILPDAFEPDSFWRNVLARHISLGPVPKERWGVSPDWVVGTPDNAIDRTWTLIGGYVRNFESVFDPAGFQLDEAEIRDLDPLFQWTLHGVRAALRDAGADGPAAHAGLVLGNLSLPSTAMARFTEHVWLHRQADGIRSRSMNGHHGRGARPSARNRFMSGLPALLTARALGLGAGAFALDAACASSIYAIKLACDRLHARSADLMVAGAVNCADDLFIHIGFCALSAMSRSGQSRPFHRNADGLLPAEGAAFVVLKRLRDAIDANDRIWGVIRGIGLSNDGRRSGMLVPSQEGQERAMRLAYESAGFSPNDISLVECHATGTLVGDATELRSLARIFEGCHDVPIGSVKSNLGHLITAAGIAGLLKVLGAMDAGIRPPTVNADDPIDAIAGTPLRILHAEEPWQGPRRAAVSAFGFGGNNAHLIVEAWEGHTPSLRRSPMAQNAAGSLLATEPVAIVAMGARVGKSSGVQDFAQALFAGKPQLEPRDTISVALRDLHFPPRDLDHTIGQQLLILEAAREAAALVHLPRERTAVLIGMGCDPEVARYCVRWRVPAWFETTPGSMTQAKDAFQQTLVAAGVLGTMPNIVANRLNVQLDLAGPSFTVSAEEASGLAALQIAKSALDRFEVDAALVGAVDLSHEPVHQAACAELGRQDSPGDAAIAIVLKRLSDARRDHDRVLAILGGEASPAFTIGDSGEFDPVKLFGSPHAAKGLLAVAAATLAIYHGARPNIGGTCQPWPGRRSAKVLVSQLEGQGHHLILSADEAAMAVKSADGHGPQKLRADIAASWPAPSQQQHQLSCSAHTPPVSMPLIEIKAQIMQRAPFLPPVFADGAPGAERSQPAKIPAPAVPIPPRTLTGAATEHYRRIAVVQQDYLRRSVQIQQQFLQLRQQQLAILMHANPGLSPHLQTTSKRQPRAFAEAAAIRNTKTLPRNGSASPLPPAHDTKRVGAPVLPEPKFNRQQLEHLASGKISELFGPLFAAQDSYARQTRMPEPPLLLADRVTGIAAEPASMGTGTLWTETDVQADSWYLGHDGRMPAGLMIESGQADLLLISWLGIDLINRGERVYRLLGCDLTFHGDLSSPGDTLAYDIHVDGHAQQGDVRLFFFHYDCHIRGQLRLTMRNGQAGFFTEKELVQSGGILWDPASEPYHSNTAPDPPAAECFAHRFDAAAVRAFADGRPVDCFGPNWKWTCTHVRSPCIGSGRMLLLHEISAFDPTGGPWKRGYLRAETPISPGDWFFAGHFKNDPCMPGTLMFEGCFQALAFYLSAMGYTIRRDGWRFEPVPDETFQLRCRGQVTPASRMLTYEVFVKEISAGPIPTIFADLLCTVDGLKAFHARNVGLRLVPDWPLTHWRELSAHTEQPTGEPVAPSALSGLCNYHEPKPVAVVDGMAYGYASLLACAWGRPTEMFGPIYARFEGPRQVARLPAPPYHFLSRIVKVEGPQGGMQIGSHVEAEYDIPANVWYFEQTSNKTMPLSVFMEAALQPCGWLSAYVGTTLVDKDLLFRNLDGAGTLTEEIGPDSGTLRTCGTLTNIAKMGDTTIISVALECCLGERRIFEGTTVFGLFPKEAFDDQVGLVPSPEEYAQFARPCDFSVDLRPRPFRYCEGALRLPGSMLMMIDRVTGYWPNEGKAGLGRLRAEKTINPNEWFFKAHFFQDPVQPGSLGIEAMMQLLQFYMIERGLGDGCSKPRFEPLRLGHEFSWKYRGQVIPTDGRVTIEMEITEVGSDEYGCYAVADAWLWVDDKRIYHARNLANRIVSAAPGRMAAREFEEDLDPATDRWLMDHAPTWTVPALPMMSMADRLAQAAVQYTGRTVAGLRDVRVRRWLPITGPVRLKTRVHGSGNEVSATLLVWRDAANPALSRFEPVASGTVLVGDFAAAPPATLPPLVNSEPAVSPYDSGALPHGPAFQYLKSWNLGANGASGVLDAGRSGVPRGALHQGLLDGFTHVIPHDQLFLWSSEIPRDRVAYPHGIVTFDLYQPLPNEGDLLAEARFAGFEDDGRQLPVTDLQIFAGGSLIAAMRLVEALVPKGRIGIAPPTERRRFLAERHYAGGLGLSVARDGVTEVTAEDVAKSDWLTGTVKQVYGLLNDPRGGTGLAEIAVRDHIARQVRVHPSAIQVGERLLQARPEARPLQLYQLSIDSNPDAASVRNAVPPRRDFSEARSWWRGKLGTGPWPGEDLFFALAKQFIGDICLEDAAALAKIRGRACLYLANHQVGVESVLFNAAISPILDRPTLTLAKAEHRDSWIGQMSALAFAYPNIQQTGSMILVERENPEAIARAFQELAKNLRTDEAGVLVHVDGTRALSCRQPAERISAALLDAAMTAGAPIVPVRFSRGLPVKPITGRLEFPLGYGRQDYWIGRPIMPNELASLFIKDRKDLVLDRINGLGPGAVEDSPAEANPEFDSRVSAWIKQSGANPESAAIYSALTMLTDPSPATRRLLEAAHSKQFEVGDDPASQWLGQLARRLFGPRGPVVTGLNPCLEQTT